MPSILAQVLPEFAAPDTDWVAISPEIALISAGFLLVAAGAVNRDRRDLTTFNLVVGLLGVIVAGMFTCHLWSVVIDESPYQALSGMVAVDGFSVLGRTIILAATALGLLLSDGFLRREGVRGPEYPALMLLSAAGMLMMASANDLIVVFLALEILSIAL